jgi:hypothetical protein
MENNLESRPSLYDAAAYLTGTNIINIFPTLRSYCLNDLADTVTFDLFQPLYACLNAAADTTNNYFFNTIKQAE